MSVEKGIIKVIGTTQVVSEKFSKREIVIIEDASGPYPQTRLYETHKPLCDTLDQYKEGDEVSFEFNRQGRAWTNKEGVEKHFNTDVIWKITKTATEPAY